MLLRKRTEVQEVLRIGPDLTPASGMISLQFAGCLQGCGLIAQQDQQLMYVDKKWWSFE
jgi:hypothetical protein